MATNEVGGSHQTVMGWGKFSRDGEEHLLLCLVLVDRESISIIHKVTFKSWQENNFFIMLLIKQHKSTREIKSYWRLRETYLPFH